MKSRGRITITRRLHASSAKFGKCEVCKRWVSDVHLRRIYDVDGRVDHVFGHRGCIVTVASGIKGVSTRAQGNTP